MTPDRASIWDRVIEIVEKLAGCGSPTPQQQANLIDQARRSGLFDTVRDETSVAGRIVVLELDPSLDREACAAAVTDLGPATNIHVVSPPIATDPPGPPLNWDRKHSLCHIIGGHDVWFGIDTCGGSETLRSIAIHF